MLPTSLQHGTRRAPPLSNGVSLLLDGIDEYVNMGVPVETSLIDDFTIECWVRTDNTDNGSHDFVANRWHGGGSGVLVGMRTNRLRCFFFTVGGMFFIQNGTASNATINLDLGDTINDDAWHHIATTYEAGRAKMFLDGVLSIDITSTLGNTDIRYIAGKELHIGKDSAGSQEFWDGEIDEVRISSRVKSINEVVRDQFRQLSSGADIVGSWSMETLFDGTRAVFNDRRDVSGSPHATDLLKDGSGNDIDGVFNGFGAGTGDLSPFQRDVPFEREYGR